MNESLGYELGWLRKETAITVDEMCDGPDMSTLQIELNATPWVN